MYVVEIRHESLFYFLAARIYRFFPSDKLTLTENTKKKHRDENTAKETYTRSVFNFYCCFLLKYYQYHNLDSWPLHRNQNILFLYFFVVVVIIYFIFINASIKVFNVAEFPYPQLLNYSSFETELKIRKSARSKRTAKNCKRQRETTTICSACLYAL